MNIRIAVSYPSSTVYGATYDAICRICGMRPNAIVCRGTTNCLEFVISQVIHEQVCNGIKALDPRGELQIEVKIVEGETYSPLAVAVPAMVALPATPLPKASEAAIPPSPEPPPEPPPEPTEEEKAAIKARVAQAQAQTSAAEDLIAWARAQSSLMSDPYDREEAQEKP